MHRTVLASCLVLVVAAFGMSEVASGQTSNSDTVTLYNAKVVGVMDWDSYHLMGTVFIRSGQGTYHQVYLWKNSANGSLSETRGSRIMSIVSSPRYDRFNFRYLESPSVSGTYLRYDAGSTLHGIGSAN